jgi:hypothetical protein
MLITKQQQCVEAEADYEHEQDAADWGTTVQQIMDRIEFEEMTRSW